MIDEVFRKNKTTQKFEDADERFLKISPLPNGSKVVDTRSLRLTYVADPVDDKDAINKSWATKYFKEEKDAITKLSESATAKSAEIDTKLVKFNSDKASIEQTGEELKVLSAEAKSKAEETKAKLESTLAQLEQAKTKIDNFNADYARAKELKGDVEGKFNEVKANLESVKAVLSDVTAKSADILSTYTNAMQGIQNSYIAAKQDLQSTGSTAKQELQSLSTSTKQEIATAKASIYTRANEALNQASTALTSIRGIIADFRGKQTELNALKASLETLKSSLENLSKSGLINDTEASIAQTYSSNKINNLLQGVLRESDATESNANGKLVKRDADGNISATNIKISDNVSIINSVADIENDATNSYQLLIRKSKDEPIKLMNLQKLIERSLYYVNNDITERVEKSYWYIPNKWQSSVRGEYSYIRAKTDEYLCLNSLKLLGKNYKGTDPTPKATDFWNSQNTSFAVLTKDGEYDVLGKCSLPTLDDRIKEQATKSVNKALADKQAVKNVTNDMLGLNEAVNFVLTLTRSIFSVIDGNSLTPETIGQSGVIVVKGARNIRGWQNFIKWRETPIDLNDTEVFAYFVASRAEVYMGRA